MKVKIKYKDILAKGLFADEFIPKNNIVLYLEGNYLPHPTRSSIQIKDDKHIESWEGGHINHHCDPNTEIRIHDDFIGRNSHAQMESSLVALVVAKRDIDMGEELTFDYEITEFELSEPFRCDCHGRWIRGKVHKYQE